MFVILPPVIFVIFWANTSVGPKPLQDNIDSIRDALRDNDVVRRFNN
jgi:DNA-binding winged helix-turn-helix (wHTH) protein